VIGTHYVYWLLFALMMVGLYVVISHGKVDGGSAPIVSDDVETYSHPLPQVLILTAIVVGVATLAVGLALAVRVFEAYGTVEEDELVEREEDELVVQEAGKDAGAAS
jgi:multicomponent Na+:H+ antiporter subunit C